MRASPGWRHSRSIRRAAAEARVFRGPRPLGRCRLARLPHAQAICDDVVAEPPEGARLVVAARCFPTGMLGYWVRQLAERAGLVALLTATSPRRLAHPEGGEPLTSTSPLAIAVPSSDGRPLVADVAMSAVTWGDVISVPPCPRRSFRSAASRRARHLRLQPAQLLVDALAGPEHGALLLVARPEHDPVPASRVGSGPATTGRFVSRRRGRPRRAPGRAGRRDVALAGAGEDATEDLRDRLDPRQDSPLCRRCRGGAPRRRPRPRRSSCSRKRGSSLIEAKSLSSCASGTNRGSSSTARARCSSAASRFAELSRAGEVVEQPPASGNSATTPSRRSGLGEAAVGEEQEDLGVLLQGWGRYASPRFAPTVRIRVPARSPPLHAGARDRGRRRSSPRRRRSCRLRP